MANIIEYNGPVRVNGYKIVKLKVGEITGADLVTNNKKTWWESNKLEDWAANNTIKAPTEVSSDIMLVPDKLNFQGSYTYETGSLNELLSDGVLGKVKDAAVNFTQAKTIASGMISNISADEVGSMVSEFSTRYGNMPIFKSVETGGLSSITFQFNYGQDYLFDANEEVVKPILRLAQIFAPIKNGTTGASSFAQVIQAPIAGKTEALLGVLKSVFSDDAASGVLSSSENDGGAGRTYGTSSYAIQAGQNNNNNGASQSKGLTRKMFEAIDEAASTLTTRVLMINIGHLYLGPYFPASINWEWDYTKTDSNGYPLSGSITFSDMKAIVNELAEDISSTVQ